MNTEIIGVVFMYLATIALAIPLGKYIAKVFKGEKTWLNLMAPLERFIFKFSGIDAHREMNWKQHLKALLTINVIWLFYAFFSLLFQGHLPLNPDNNPNQTPDLAFNTALSFLTNTNLQDYSGESGATYFTQHFVFMFLHFVSAATGLAAMMVVFKAMKEKTTEKLGNFWEFFLKSITRILLPISIVVAVILAFNGTPTSYKGKDTVIGLQGDTVHVSRGPAAAMIAIKQVGTNGGGWFGTNSAHPFENPNYLTNMVENISIILIPIALVFALGFYLNKKKLSWVIFGVMTIGFLIMLIPSITVEVGGNPAIAHMGISQPGGSMEGKEVRFGPAASAYWGITTTVTSNGSVNAMHDSMMPISGLAQMFDMMINAFYGGVGVGFLNFYIFIIIAVFISGLMVGRTPEFMGRKIEAREMKIASLIALLHPFIILVGTSLASYVLIHFPNINWGTKPSAWLNNPGFHGFTEMLYQYASSAANNGSGYAGLTANNIFWNVSTGLVIFVGRFLPIIGPVAIAGILASKKAVPESAGTLKTDTATFGIMIFAVIFIIAALSFFPALTLGPIAEHFSIK
ncbi:K+-transporting ATPase ATPase A chain [Mucilaginibacter frigoritolerans]|uniref:Potassium-transporting ATPase potassium-binding subunit n=1 Tax=Mucilaginibacter frigoritolerans TaxID=652788 RepID=A0A562TZ34_9SPHI|nr:potassium-transporting ATPase subunit KdpA [Mucilaginibacter frigoritolerans]TWI98827.1 K+-transporting ATPase ATPase A chain [Mucilaginibacter frigoritolerans]